MSFGFPLVRLPSTLKYTICFSRLSWSRLANMTKVVQLTFDDCLKEDGLFTKCLPFLPILKFNIYRIESTWKDHLSFLVRKSFTLKITSKNYLCTMLTWKRKPLKKRWHMWKFFLEKWFFLYESSSLYDCLLFLYIGKKRAHFLYM